MTDHTETAPIRKSSLPATPPPEFEFFTWFPWPDGDGGDMVRGQRQRGVQVRRLVTYGDWEPVHPDRWADEPETDTAAAAVPAGQAPATAQAAVLPVPRVARPLDIEHDELMDRAAAEHRARTEAVAARKTADRAAVLRWAAARIDNEELPDDYVDVFDNGVRWAARLLRRLAAEPPVHGESVAALAGYTPDGRDQWDGETDDDEAQQPPTDRSALMRAHTALAAQAGRDQAALQRVRDVLETEAVVGRTALEYHGLILAALMGDEAQQQEPGDEGGPACAHCGGDHSWGDCEAYTALVADETATTETPCGPAPDRCDAEAGEPCADHERQQAHEEGEHCFCGPECDEQPAAGAQQQPKEAPTVAYSGKGRTFCVRCPRPDGEDVPLTINDVDPWDLCPSCGRHVVDIARARQDGAAS